MLIKQTKDMTDSERIAVENSNNQYLEYLCTEAKTLVENIADYPVETGIVEVDGTTWIYEKQNNGIAKMWCMATPTYTTAFLLEHTGIQFPFVLTENGIGFVTINKWVGGSTAETARVLCKTDKCTVQVSNHLGGFVSGTTLNVAVQVIGKWK